MAAKWAAIAGIVFGVLFVVGLIMVSDTPDNSDSDETIINWYADSSNQQKELIGAYIMVVAGIAAVTFVTIGLKPRVEAASRNQGDAALAALVQPAALLMAAAFIIGVMALAGAAATAFFDDVPVDPGVARFLPGAGYGTILVGGALCAAFLMTITSIHALRTGSLPAWFAWLGFLCALAMLGGVIFLPMIALPIWAIVGGVVLWMRGEPAVSRSTGTLSPQP